MKREDWNWVRACMDHNAGDSVRPALVSRELLSYLTDFTINNLYEDLWRKSRHDVPYLEDMEARKDWLMRLLAS